MPEDRDTGFLEDSVRSWVGSIATWSDAPDEWRRCHACDASIVELEAVLGPDAPHLLTHDLHALITEEHARRLAASRASCIVCASGGLATAQACPTDHDADARADVMELLDIAAGAAPRAIARRVADAHRRQLAPDQRYIIRRLEEWLEERARAWQPSRDAVLPTACSLCFGDHRRGDALIIRLPHDLRHDLLELLIELQDDFATAEQQSCTVCRGVRPREEAGPCHHRRDAAALVHGVWTRSALALRTVLHDVIDPRRRAWVAERLPLSVSEMQHEAYLAAADPEYNGLFWNAVGPVLIADSEGDDRRSAADDCEICYRSPTAAAVCPTMHWPHWLLHGVVEAVSDLRADVFRDLATRSIDDGDVDEDGTVPRHRSMAPFDAWLAIRLTHAGLLEHTAASVVREALTAEEFARSGLRLMRAG